MLFHKLAIAESFHQQSRLKLQARTFCVCVCYLCMDWVNMCISQLSSGLQVWPQPRRRSREAVSVAVTASSAWVLAIRPRSATCRPETVIPSRRHRWCQRANRRRQRRSTSPPRSARSPMASIRTASSATSTTPACKWPKGVDTPGHGAYE